MRKKRFWNITLVIFVMLSVLGLMRPRNGDRDSGPVSAELTRETTVSGNQEYQTYVNQDGAAVLAVDRGYATLLRTRDADGNVVLEQYLDARGKPAVRSGNYAAIAYRREEGGLWITYLDEALNPTTHTSGYCAIFRRLTPEGKALTDVYYDLRGKPVKCTGGYYGLLRSYDSQGRVNELTYLDAAGKPMPTKYGYSRELRILEETGRVAAVFYQDAEGNPVPGSLGQFGERYGYDENGRESQVTYLDAAGSPAPVTSGYTILRRTYWRDGSIREETYFDAAGNPVALSKGQYGIRRDGDVTLLLNRDGQPMLSVDNLLAGFPLTVVLAGCVLCAAMTCLPKKAAAALLAAYVLFIFYETLMFRESGNPQTELLPFSYLGSFWNAYSVRSEVINNVWLFVPLGAGLYRFSRKKAVLWIPFLLTAAIELTQYLTGLGFAQADDILGNTFGGLLGFQIADRLRPLSARAGSWRKTRAHIP